MGLLTFLMLVSCGPKPLKLPDYGLPRIELTLSSQDLGELESTVADKNEVPAQLQGEGTSLPIHISYSGKSSLYFRKRSFQVTSRGGEFWGVRSFRLSAQGADPSFLRTQLGFRAFQEAGFITPQTRSVALFVNGQYQGLYLWIEDVDVDFFQRRSLPTRSIYKARYGRLGYADLDFDTLPYLKVGFKVIQGSEDLADLQEQIYRLSLPLDAQNAAQLIQDLSPLIRYQAVAALLNHWDGFKNNFILFRLEGESSFSWMPWDGDQIYSDKAAFNRFDPVNSLWGEARAAQWIQSYPALCEQYLQVISDFLEGPLESSRLQAWLNAEAEAVATAYQEDPNYSRFDQTERKSALEQARDSWLSAMKEAYNKARQEQICAPK
jgi:spore coat protein H